jgi:hypothetical protein
MNIRIIISAIYLSFLGSFLLAQDNFKYDIHLEPQTIDGLVGLHSFAYAQHDGKWLLVGGRRDGIHARQPFNAFPASENNAELFVVDPISRESWKAGIESLPGPLQEQLQATDFQFYQDEQNLILIGGYAYSASMGDHTTFAYLTLIDIPNLIEDIINGEDISVAHFQQIEAEEFAVTGGQLGKIGDTFYLIGGHRFEGRYNPMNHPTFIQTYTDAIRKFTLSNTNGLWTHDNVQSITDPVHLHRRDYNLLPQRFSDGTLGYTISSGVFQINEDLPFLYPVHVTDAGYEPINDFNQYLSHYDCARASLYDGNSSSMHHIFFGGISQYYYEGEELIQDDNVPFVKTISLLSMDANGVLSEERLPVEMPAYLGASAAFIVNEALPSAGQEIIALSGINEDSILIGYIVGGIESEIINPFSFNSDELTEANSTIYAVYLSKSEVVGSKMLSLPGYHDLNITIYPNPNNGNVFRVKVDAPKAGYLELFLTDSLGKLVLNEVIEGLQEGDNTVEIDMQVPVSGVYSLTAILNSEFSASGKIVFD